MALKNNENCDRLFVPTVQWSAGDAFYLQYASCILSLVEVEGSARRMLSKLAQHVLTKRSRAIVYFKYELAIAGRFHAKAFPTFYCKILK